MSHTPSSQTRGRPLTAQDYVMNLLDASQNGVNTKYRWDLRKVFDHWNELNEPTKNLFMGGIVNKHGKPRPTTAYHIPEHMVVLLPKKRRK